MTATEIVGHLLTFGKDIVLPIITFVVLPVFWWYTRDRRKSRAETAVVERTVDADVAAKEASGLGASVGFVQEAFRLERLSYLRRIKDLEDEMREVEERCDEKVAGLRAELAQKDSTIGELRDQLGTVVADLARLRQQLQGGATLP